MTGFNYRQALLAIMLYPIADAAATRPTETVQYFTAHDSLINEARYVEGDIDDSHWWTRFNDPMLDSLVMLACERNYDLSMASRRIEIARQGVNSSRAAYYPQLNVNAGWTRSQQAGAVVNKDTRSSSNSYWNAGATMNWEIDLFGKITAQVHQSKSQLRVSRADFGAAMVSLQAQMATAYINLRVYQAEMEVAINHTDNQLKVVHITEARHKAGLASMLDVAQAKTVYYSTVASIPLLRTSIRSTINSIAVLIGENPSAMYEILGTPRPMPDHLQIVEAEIPLDLLNRRPDVVAARQNVEAAADALGIARKAYLPSLTVSGSLGTSAHRADDLFGKNSLTYSVAPTLSWTLFDGMARRSASIEAKQRLESEVDNYNLTMLTAVEETDNAITTYMHDIEYMKSIQEVVNQSSEAFDLSLDLYKRGLSAFTNVVDAQLNMLEYQNSLIVAKGDAIVSLINLYKALGGGWTNDVDAGM